MKNILLRFVLMLFLLPIVSAFASTNGPSINYFRVKGGSLDYNLGDYIDLEWSADAEYCEGAGDPLKVRGTGQPWNEHSLPTSNDAFPVEVSISPNNFYENDNYHSSTLSPVLRCYKNGKSVEQRVPITSINGNQTNGTTTYFRIKDRKTSYRKGEPFTFEWSLDFDNCMEGGARFPYQNSNKIWAEFEATPKARHEKNPSDTYLQGSVDLLYSPQKPYPRTSEPVIEFTCRKNNPYPGEKAVHIYKIRLPEPTLAPFDPNYVAPSNANSGTGKLYKLTSYDEKAIKVYESEIKKVPALNIKKLEVDSIANGWKLKLHFLDTQFTNKSNNSIGSFYVLKERDGVDVSTKEKVFSYDYQNSKSTDDYYVSPVAQGMYSSTYFYDQDPVDLSKYKYCYALLVVKNGAVYKGTEGKTCTQLQAPTSASSTEKTRTEKLREYLESRNQNVFKSVQKVKNALTSKGLKHFTDIDPQTLEGVSSGFLKDQKIIEGEDNAFNGDRAVNRAEITKFLLLSARKSALTTTTSLFKDILGNSWYNGYVTAAQKLGIINGYSDGTFRPSKTVNTAEFLKMLTKTFNATEGVASYADVPSGAWYAPYSKIAKDYNLFPNRPTSELQPYKLMTRNEVAVAIYKYLKNNPLGANYEYEFDENQNVKVYSDYPNYSSENTTKTTTPYVSSQRTAAQKEIIEKKQKMFECLFDENGVAQCDPNNPIYKK